MPRRDRHIDSVKGVLIFLVVLGHLLEHYTRPGIVDNLYRFIYFFHMPAFVFICGMFSHREGSHGSRLLTTILVPLLVFEALYEGAFVVLHDGVPSGNLAQLAPEWILWFLLSLFFWRLAAPVLARLRHPLSISFVLAFAALSVDETGYYLALGRTFSFLPFFVAGLVHGKAMVAYLARPRPAAKTCAVGLAAVMVLAGVYLAAPHFPIHLLYGSYSFGDLGVSVPRGALLRALAYALSFAALGAVLALAMRTTAFAPWGRASIHVYLWHGLALWCLFKARDALRIGGVPTWGVLAATLLTATGLCVLFSRAPVQRGTDRVFSRVSSMLQIA